MRRLVVVVLAAALLGASAGGAPAGGFERKPVDKKLLTSPYVAQGGYQLVQYTSDKLFDTLPEGVEHNVKYGRTALDGGEPLAFVVCASQAGGPLDTLYIDVKRSGDLAEATVVKDLTQNAENEVSLTLADGETVQLKIVLTDSYLLVQGEPFWWLGTVEIDGQTHMAALVDQGADGIQEEGGNDLLLIDLDGSGVFESDPSNGFLGEANVMQSEILVRGKMYDLAFDADAFDVRLTPYEGPLGWLALDVELEKAPESFLFTAYYFPNGESASGPKYVFGDSESFPLPFKPTELERMIGIMQIKFETDNPATMQFEVQETLSFQADATTTLTIGPHDPMEVTAYQTNDRLMVSQTLTGPGGVVYQRIQRMPRIEAVEDGDSESIRDSESVNEAMLLANRGPQVTVLDADGQVLAEGAMEYG